MSLKIQCVTVDAHDPAALAGWWAEALGFKVKELEDEDEVAIIPPQRGKDPAILFIHVPDDKVAKNRIHFDLTPDDRDAEVARLLGMGATRVDIGQSGDESWVVLADPEGNELCVLAPRA
ncbi:MAG TPA: VOC family protein [Acidimicrobiales bacterium]|nr:VOC family protein [Acidimicrobiales bacterium]